MSDHAAPGGMTRRRPGQPDTDRPNQATQPVPPPPRPAASNPQKAPKPTPATVAPTAPQPSSNVSAVLAASAPHPPQAPSGMGPRPGAQKPGPRPAPPKPGFGSGLVGMRTGKKPVGKGKVTQANRRAHLRITKLDLLAILKMSFLFAFAVSVVIFTACFILWNLLLATGAIDGAQNLLNSVMGNPNGQSTVQLTEFLNTSRVIGFIAGVSVINVFILTLLGTLFGALYNLASVMFGGLEVTLEV